MKIIGVVLATVLVGVLAFQNCQQSPNASDLMSGTLNTTDAVDLRGEKISEIQIPFTENESVTKVSGAYTVAVNKSLQIFLDSGRIFLSSDISGTSQEYCLTETLLNELVGLLKTSQICKNKIDTANQMCAMVYKHPYAILITEKNTYKLGEAPNSCGAPLDLCGEQVDALQGFIASVKAHYKSLTCQ